MVSNTKIKTNTKKTIPKSKIPQKDKFIIDTMPDFYNNVGSLLPITNRYHLRAALEDLQKETAGSEVIDYASYTTIGNNQMLYLKDERLLEQFKANKNNRPIIISEPAYDQATLWRIHDCYRSEGSVRRTLDTLIDYTVGRKRTRVILDTNDYYDNEENENTDLDDIQNNELYQKYVRGISKINKKLNLSDAQKVLMTNALIFGHGALLIEYDKEPLNDPTAVPIALKPLSSLRIGRVFYYEDTWELAGIEYLDFANVIIEPYRLIYYANKDYHISPRTIYHGLSVIEPIIDVAETLIMNNQTNIKEINRRLWAAFIVIKYMGKKQSDIDRFKSQYKPGMPIISNRDFEAQVFEVAHDLDKLLSQNDQSARTIARALSVPQIFAGFDDQTQKANVGPIAQMFIASTIEAYRTALRNVFEKQWINTLLKRLIFINGDYVQFLKTIPADLIKISTSFDTIQDFPNDSPYNIIANNTGDPSGQLLSIKDQFDNFDVTDLAFKIKLQFAQFSPDTLLDKSSSVLGLKNAGILDVELALTELDRPEYIPHMKQVMKDMQEQFQQLAQEGEVMDRLTDAGELPGVPPGGQQSQSGIKGPNPNLVTKGKISSKAPNPTAKAANKAQKNQQMSNNNSNSRK